MSQQSLSGGPACGTPLAVLLVAALASPVDAASAAGPAGFYHASGPLQGSLLRDEPAPVYSADPADPWNQIHHLLFSSWSKALVYLDDPTVPPPEPADAAPQGSTVQSALGDHLRRRYLTKTVVLQRLEGGDRPDFFFPSGDIGFLLEPSRCREAAAALERELATPHLAGRTPGARLLFQQDLWNRFDGLAPASRESSARRTRRQRLRSLVGRLLARVALSSEELGRIRSNLAEVAEAHPEVGRDLFAKDTRWRELEATSRDGPLQTFHTSTAGLRRVFRVFLRVPEQAGGAACLESYLAARGASPDLTCAQDGGLVDGTRALLLETPLAVSDKGEIVAVPLVVSVEARSFARLLPTRLGLADLPFVVLHGSRLALSSAERVGGGLELLPAGEPLPQLLGCFTRPRGGPLLPARLSCATCHGIDGRRLMIGNFKVLTRLDVLHPDNTRAQERVIRAKEQSADYRALRDFFPRD